MIQKRRPRGQVDVVRAALSVPAVFVGVLLPLDFLGQVDGYIVYLRPLELLLVFAWGWILYALLGFAALSAAAVPTVLVATLARQSPGHWVARVTAWLSLMLIAVGLLLSLRVWLTAAWLAVADWLAQAQWALIALIGAGCAAWIWRHSTLPAGLVRFMRFSAASGLMLTLTAFLAAWAASPASPNPAVHGTVASVSQRPHVILITIDALAAAHASLYGYARPTTPNLERLAEQAHVFERFYANSNFTTPAVTSFMHGVRPWTHRANQLRARVDARVAQEGLLPRLKSAGYQSFAVATNPHAAPFRNGTDELFDRIAYGRVRHSAFIADSALSSRFPSASPAFFLGFASSCFALIDKLLVRGGAWSSADHFDPELAFSAARRLVETRNAATPMFLWVHLMQPHDPYAAGGQFLGRFDPGPHARTRFDSVSAPGFLAGDDAGFPGRYVGRYDEGIVNVDHHVGLFIEWLKRNGLFDAALLVITADHGESFSHGYGGHSGPLMHDHLIRVPFVVKEPEQKTGKRLDVLAEHIDLLPTILDLAGIGMKEQLEGRSLKPAMREARMTGPVFSMNFQHSSRFGEFDKGSVAMLDGNWKYVHYRGRLPYLRMPVLEDALYDLRSDPREIDNLIAAQPAIAAKMRGEIEMLLQKYGRASD